MRHESKPIFFSATGRRWKAFKGVTRLLGLFVAVGVVVAAIAVVYDPFTSETKGVFHQANVYHAVLNPDKITTFATPENRAFHSLRAHWGKDADVQYRYNRKTNLQAALPRFQVKEQAQIRAAFYVNWDIRSWYSLRNHIGELTMVLPEWFSLADSVSIAGGQHVPPADSLIASDVDARALAYIREHNVAIVPILSNYDGTIFNESRLQQHLATKERRERLVQTILRLLQRYGFAGINIDFENLTTTKSQNLVALFQAELYAALHPMNYLVTQDVAPFDTHTAQFATHNDYLFLMGYDLHYSTSEPGAIAPIKWVESALDQACRVTSPQKIILCLAAYGYDWAKTPEGFAEAEDVSYEEAIVTAKESEGVMDFDNDNYNLHYTYADDNDIPHEVWLTDAATAFNTMRSAANVGTAGVALWRLGGEDARLWKFFKLSMTMNDAKRHAQILSSIEEIPVTSDVNYSGEGEVLDVVATPSSGFIDLEYNAEEDMISEETYKRYPSSYFIRKSGKPANEKTVVLTFDDGPSAEYTGKILDILKAENVPATFFVIGLNAERNLDVLKRIYDEGYEIGNHTFTHPNIAEVSTERAALELNATQRIIECVTGHSTVLFRPPYNADSEPETMEEVLPVALAKQHNYYTVGESIDPCDWQENISADTILARTIAEERNGTMILLHDAGGDRTATLEALPRIIRYFKSKGYTFTTVAGLLGTMRENLMPQLVSSNDVLFSRINWFSAGIVWRGGRLLRAIFIVGIVLGIGRMATIILLAWRQRTQERHFAPSTWKPLVSVIVPAYNEEVNAARTVHALLASDYAPLEIVFVDDGSSDATYKHVEALFTGNSRVSVLTKPNGGKASALNFGIGRAKGEIVVCIDADTQLAPDAITRLVEQFVDDSVGAVAGNVQVGNAHNILTRWQSIEYTVSQNLDKRAFALLGCIMVVPGAIGAFRREALMNAGSFATDTLAEDCDLTIRLLKEGYTVRSAQEAFAYTEAPETAQMFFKQRFRWSFGILQALWKHREAFLNPQYKALGMVALPQSLLFQFMLPLIAPVADIMLLGGLLSGDVQQIGTYYAAFLAAELFAAIVAYSFDDAKILSFSQVWSMLWLFMLQRFVYRYMMYVPLVRSLLSVVRGTLVGWGVLKRMGTVVVAKA